jgi:hypothetical protein
LITLAAAIQAPLAWTETPIPSDDVGADPKLAHREIKPVVDDLKLALQQDTSLQRSIEEEAVKRRLARGRLGKRLLGCGGDNRRRVLGRIRQLGAVVSAALKRVFYPRTRALICLVVVGNDTARPIDKHHIDTIAEILVEFFSQTRPLLIRRQKIPMKWVPAAEYQQQATIFSPICRHWAAGALKSVTSDRIVIPQSAEGKLPVPDESL